MIHTDRYKDWTGKEPFQDTEAFFALKVTPFILIFLTAARTKCTQQRPHNNSTILFFPSFLLFFKVLPGGSAGPVCSWLCLQVPDDHSGPPKPRAVRDHPQHLRGQSLKGEKENKDVCMGVWMSGCVLWKEKYEVCTGTKIERTRRFFFYAKHII